MEDLERGRRAFGAAGRLPTITLLAESGLHWVEAPFGLGPLVAHVELDGKNGAARAVVDLGYISEPEGVEEIMHGIPYPSPTISLPPLPGASATLTYEHPLASMTEDTAIGLLSACALYSVAFAQAGFDLLSQPMRDRLVAAGFDPDTGFDCDPRRLLAHQPAPSPTVKRLVDRARSIGRQRRPGPFS